MQYELEQAGQRPSKGERKARSAQEQVLKRYLGTQSNERQFADPAAFFSK